MEIQEYNDRLKKIETDYDSSKKQLFFDYGLSQARYKIGDIIKDHRWIMKINKIKVYKGISLPGPVYHGIELKKDLKPKANASRVAIYGNSGIELLKQLSEKVENN